MKGLIGKKVGMTHLYTETGEMVPVTVIEAGPCTVTAARTQEKDGYSALQLGFGQHKAKNVSKAVQAHVEKAGYLNHVPAKLGEIRLTEDPQESVGDVLYADLFAAEEFVDITGTMKGRGFQGVVRRWNFAGGRASHGGDWLRRGGSIGMCEHPGKVFKKKKMPGHMGNVRRTVQNLRVVQVRKDDNLIMVKGAIPGANGQLVIVKQAKKK